MSADENSITSFAEVDPPDPKLKTVNFRVRYTLSYSEYFYPIFLPFAFFVALICFSLFLFCVFYPGIRPNLVEKCLTACKSTDLSGGYNTIPSTQTKSNCPCIADLNNYSLSQKLVKNSHKYYGLVFTVAIFYGVPVFQLLEIYKQIWKRTGDNDLCYYNFKCAHPLWGLVDFNHIYSNMGYILLGIFFNILVYHKQKLHDIMKETIQTTSNTNCNIQDNEEIQLQNFGTIQNFGIYYALGFALIMEGVLSGAYHVCPNRSNFQFDTSFMYIIAILFIVKIYRFRHPVKINANRTFAVVAVIALISVLGLLVSQIVVAIIFSCVHLSAVMYIQVYMYYVGYIKDVDDKIITDRRKIIRAVWQMWKETHLKKPVNTWLNPCYISRILLPVLTVPFNFGVIVMYFFNFQDFATHLLYIFVGNLLLYLTYYINMKACHGDFNSFKAIQPLCYIPLNLILWGFAMNYFTKGLTSWEKSPAESREGNRDCFSMGFYDHHDMWHFISAGALFCSFMMLLTLEDVMEKVPQSNIPVF